MARRSVHSPISSKEFNDGLTGIGMSEHEFCKLTGQDIRRVRAWLASEDNIPPWVRSWIAMAAHQDASDDAHARVQEAIVEPRARA